MKRSVGRKHVCSQNVANKHIIPDQSKQCQYLTKLPDKLVDYIWQKKKRQKNIKQMSVVFTLLKAQILN